MKKSYRKGVAIHPGPESCVASREAAIEAGGLPALARGVSGGGVAAGAAIDFRADRNSFEGTGCRRSTRTAVAFTTP
jgi:hypothetical protein